MVNKPTDDSADQSADTSASEVSDQDRADATALVMDLVAMDRRAKAQGHSLLQILQVTAKQAFGIDLTEYPARQYTQQEVEARG